MSGLLILAIVLLLGAEGYSQNDDPILIPPAQSVPVGTPDSCSAEEDLINAKNDLRESISDLLTPGNYSCGGTSGWARVAYLDMTDPAQSCPSGWNLVTPTSLRLCARTFSTCDSTFYNTSGLQYNRVCGRIRAYQLGPTAAFIGGPTASIDGHYLDGVSLTHGYAGSRTHIWSFASGITELLIQSHSSQLCPCLTPDANQPPPFVGEDYFCESAIHSTISGSINDLYFLDDPLFDGRACTLSCCQNEYFTKSLPTRTTDEIEIRICSLDSPGRRGVVIEQMEVYVQ